MNMNYELVCVFLIGSSGKQSPQQLFMYFVSQPSFYLLSNVVFRPLNKCSFPETFTIFQLSTKAPIVKLKNHSGKPLLYYCQTNIFRKSIFKHKIFLGVYKEKHIEVDIPWPPGPIHGYPRALSQLERSISYSLLFHVLSHPQQLTRLTPDLA
jgi:hypothetical protein